MLDLNHARWAELEHAYGDASDIPDLLRQLQDLPSSVGESEPWFTLWSSLAHQGDVYSASFAAVPHVVEALASAPLNADESYFLFPAWVDVCRNRKQFEVPVDLRAAYHESLSRLPQLVAAAAEKEWDASFLSCALAAIAVAKGQPVMAQAILEMTSPETAEEYLEWLLNR